MNGGDVIFKFKGDTSPIKNAASKLKSSISGMAKASAKALVGIGTAATTALIGVSAKAVQMRAEVEQQIGGTEAVFGQFAKTVQDDASKAFDKMGLSASEYMQYINKMGSLMQGSGISTKRSMDLSSKAMQRAADVASIMGIDVEDAMQAINGAAKGNFTMMDNLGVAMNATSLSAYALAKGIKKSYKNMSQAEKVELAMQMFMEKTAKYAGNYAKENDTLAGSFTTLKAAAKNFLSGTGDVKQLLGALKNFGKILATNLKTLLPDIVKGLVELINGIIPMLPEIIEAVLPALIDGIVQLSIGIMNALPQIVQTIADMLPTLMPQIIQAILLLIPAIIKCNVEFIKAGWKLIKGLFKGMGETIKQLGPKLVTWSLEILDKIKGVLSYDNLKEIGKNLMRGLKAGIESMKNTVKKSAQNAGSALIIGLKNVLGIHSPSKEFEIIGRYNILGLEQGMEKESLKLQDTFDSMFDLSPNLYGSSSLNLSPIVNVTNNITMEQDPLGQMVNKIKTYSGGAKNDYSYGMGVR